MNSRARGGAVILASIVVVLLAAGGAWWRDAARRAGSGGGARQWCADPSAAQLRVGLVGGLRLHWSVRTALPAEHASEACPATQPGQGRAALVWRGQPSAALEQPSAALEQPSAAPDLVEAHVAGCLVVARESREFLVAELGALAPGETVRYAAVRSGGCAAEAGAEVATQGSWTAPSARAGYATVAVGDTGEARGAVLASAAAAAPVLALHLGDMSYASNAGGPCFREQARERRCAHDCSRGEPDCEGRLGRHGPREAAAWDALWRDLQPLAARAALEATAGNHDNDLFFLLALRLSSDQAEASEPEPARTALAALAALRGAPAVEQMGAAHELLRWPRFGSFDLGAVHYVQLQSEDNGVNAYERARELSRSGGLEHDAALAERFAESFGRRSAQLRWLASDLEHLDRARTPFVVAFTHRPLFHSSAHHPSCTVGAEWYGCEWRRAYAPLLQRHNVSLVLSGHSHHYSRTHPLWLKPDGAVQVAAGGPVYAVVGTGGFRLENAFEEPMPRWQAFREGDRLGYGLLHVVPDPTESKGHGLILRWGFHDAAGTLLDQVDLARA
jgi:hypothetical protein